MAHDSLQWRYPLSFASRRGGAQAAMVGKLWQISFPSTLMTVFVPLLLLGGYNQRTQGKRAENKGMLFCLYSIE